MRKTLEWSTEAMTEEANRQNNEQGISHQNASCKSFPAGPPESVNVSIIVSDDDAPPAPVVMRYAFTFN